MSSTNLMAANHEWSSRPADEWFMSIDALVAKLQARRERSFEAPLTSGALRVQAIDDHKLLVAGASPTRWAFEQVCKRAKAPADYLSTLPAPIVAASLNHSLAKDATRNDYNLFAERTAGGMSLRALTTEAYSRVYDVDIARKGQELMDASGGDWTHPWARIRHEAHRPFVQSKPDLGGRMSEMVPSGMYASDRDLFLFLVNEKNPITVGNEMLNRGFFLRHSEVGGGSLWIQAFLYRMVCGNNIVWGAHQLAEVRKGHLGKTAEVKINAALVSTLKSYVEAGTHQEQLVIDRATKFSIGKNDDEATNWIVGQDFTRKLATAAVDRAKVEEGGAGTLWQAVQGLTAVARELPHTDARVALESKAGKLLELVN